MATGGGVLRRTGLVAGVAAGALGLAYAGERALVARIRHRDDLDAGLPLVPQFDHTHVLDSHDGGSIYTIARGEGPTIMFCHGVTLSSRVWAKQFDAFPAAGFRAVAYDARGHGESRTGDTGHSLDNLADDLRGVLEGLDVRVIEQGIASLFQAGAGDDAAAAREPAARTLSDDEMHEKSLIDLVQH
jgi:hypothetical protein